MALDCKYKHPLEHDGTSQHQRMLEALEPGNARIHEFSLKDWMRFAWHFASHLNYYNLKDDLIPESDWQVFMKDEDEIEEFLKDSALAEDESWIEQEERLKILQREPKGDFEPHLALFLSFLKLLKYSREHLNGFTRHHLNFYYGEVLQISKRPFIPDKVHVIFELAKNASQELVKKDLALDAGKDKNGKPMQYKIREELVVNTAKVSLLQSIFHQPGKAVRYAEMTNSSDGQGTEFKEGVPAWQPFGDESWPFATLGFALASSVLLLKEGKRIITIALSLKFRDTQDMPSADVFQSQLKIFLSGEKEWMQPDAISVTHAPSSSTDKLEFTVTVDASRKAIIPFDKKIHGERLNTNLPVLRVLMNTGEPDGYRVYRSLTGAILQKADISVTVTGVKDLTLENDNGRLDPSKPFLPFGPMPKTGAGFYIGNPEIFQKKWTSIKLNFVWKDKPDALNEHYKAYRKELISGESSTYELTAANLTGTAVVDADTYFKVFPQYINLNSWFPASIPGNLPGLFDPGITINKDAADLGSPPPPDVPGMLMHKGIDVNKATLLQYLASSQKTGEETGGKKKSNISSRFESAKFDPGFRRLNIEKESFDAATHSGFVRLNLQNDFLHEHYAKLLTLAMIRKSSEGHPEVLMPSQPYTPQAKSITIDYTAAATNTFVFSDSADPKEKFNNFSARTIQLFHETSFGQSEQHIFLKEQSSFLDPTERRNLSLLPSFSPEGEFYVGISNAQPSATLSILFQSLEGSEDPLSPTFIGDQRIQWFALSNNEWKLLNKDFITGDDTQNFLRPGVVKFSLPAIINSSNTLLDEGYYWLKARLPLGLVHTSVCKLTGVFAQAGEAVFADDQNEFSHLLTSLPSGTLARFLEKPALIKGLSQPFASFNGVAPENDNAYYLRVSERLRHKQRAVNIWDYERLVLQHFPSIYKVKCLSHTSTHNREGLPDYFELSPGTVSLLVIPDIRNKNGFDLLQPRASQNVLREIEDFLKPLNSLHVRFDADHPRYETIQLDFRVKFYDSYDADYYLKVLNEDIIRYLAPWAYGESSDIHFGGNVYKSVIIRFIEELEYVDFISQFRMYHHKSPEDKNVNDLNMVTASSARAILTSVSHHNIGIIEKDEVCNE